LFRRRRDAGREKSPAPLAVQDFVSNVVHELRDSYAHLPPIRQVAGFVLINTAGTDIFSPRSVKDIAEAPGAEVHLCKVDMWQDATNRFPGLSLE